MAEGPEDLPIEVVEDGSDDKYVTILEGAAAYFALQAGGKFTVTADQLRSVNGYRLFVGDNPEEDGGGFAYIVSKSTDDERP